MHFINKDEKKLPQGFKTAVSNIGIRDETDDFVCIHSSTPCKVAGVFTKSRFAGPSVNICRKHIADGQGQTIVAISKNANVANGEKGAQDAQTIVELCALQLGIDSRNVFIASTGVIGRLYPMEKIITHVASLSAQMTDADFSAAARGIMTTDTVPKIASIQVGDASLVGIAKGVGMMEPNMATLLTFFMTDANLPDETLSIIFKRVMDKTFNCLSIDTDTSTSDSAIILANGLAGDVNVDEFESALYKVSEYLVKEIAKDGEGATKLIEVNVDTASSERQAKRIAKAIVNSPLVKTAVHGADPNWGRVAMAIGKCDEELDINAESTIIRFCGFEVYPKSLSQVDLNVLTQLLHGKEIDIHVSLGNGQHSAKVWGCDLGKGYIDVNTTYST
ncbi:bifunctional glutamate N-acetyltransferase/amino-acid acetyltransferase ArgJ [Cellvibrio sp. UBA7671]|uniref:bifunctional glutamate N-acetyltransferase/amino-acid acetyltransferase ArgJ n=1 Tax=Cellvibrio sp. UBA7671 TaxID=1946312 RepID=UPI002F35D9DB